MKLSLPGHTLTVEVGCCLLSGLILTVRWGTLSVRPHIDSRGGILSLSGFILTVEVGYCPCQATDSRGGELFLSGNILRTEVG